LLALAVASAPAAAQQFVWKHAGVAYGGHFGSALDALGDVDGDGICDLVVGAPGDSTHFFSEGRVSVLSGKSGKSLYKIFGGQKNAGLGGKVCRLSDIDGDRIRDFLTLQYDQPKSVYVLTARDGATGAVIWEHRDPFTTTVSNFANAGDLDGDGLDDLVVGLWDNGAAIYSGRLGTEVMRLPRPSNSHHFGTAVGGGGDVDGDGVPDVIVSDPEFHVRRHFAPGAAWVFSGATGRELWKVVGADDGSGTGSAVAILGDLDGDGHAEFAVGAPYDDRWTTGGSGFAEVHSGADGSLRSWYAPVFPAVRSGQLGTDVANVGDVNRDGIDDYTVSSVGVAFLQSGRDGRLLYHYENQDSTTGFGYGLQVVPVGDVDGDGRLDVAISDPYESFAKFGFEGSVSVRQVRELMADASPRVLLPYDSYMITVGQGQAGQPFGIALVEVSGTAAFTLLAGGALDPTGRGYLSGRIFYGLSGMSFAVRGLVVDAAGKLIVTEVETITCQ
jgi:hypothetical protein